MIDYVNIEFMVNHVQSLVNFGSLEVDELFCLTLMKYACIMMIGLKFLNLDEFFMVS